MVEQSGAANRQQLLVFLCNFRHRRKEISRGGFIQIAYAPQITTPLNGHKYITSS